MLGTASWLCPYKGETEIFILCCVGLGVVCAVCFTEHNLPMDDLRKLVTPYYPDIMSRSNKSFWQRKVGWEGREDRGGWLNMGC